MQEETKWVPESVPQIPQNPVPAVNSQPPVPTTVSKKGIPLFLKLMIGCGCVAALGLPFILIMVGIIAVNPTTRINEAKEKSAQAALRSVAESVKNCIVAEKAKSTPAQQIFSTTNGCGDKNYLLSSKYQDSVVFVETTYLTDSANTKICIYTDHSGKIISWDSTVGVISAVGEGKTTCQ